MNIEPQVLGELEPLVAKLRELRISHFKVGSMELWLDPVYDAKESDVEPAPAKQPPVVDSDWSDEELSYLPGA